METKMKNVIVRYSELNGEVKRRVNEMLEDNDPDFISFPYKGQLVKGFIFNWQDTSYLIIHNSISQNIAIEDTDEEESTEELDTFELEASDEEE